MLRREPVVDRNGDASRLVGERAAYAVMTLEIAEHPSTAVKINQHTHRRIPLGRVNAHANLAVGARDFAILDPIDLWRRNRIRLEQRAHLGPRLIRSLGAQEHRPRRIEHIEHDLHLGIEGRCHARSLGEASLRGKRKLPPILNPKKFRRKG